MLLARGTRRQGVAEHPWRQEAQGQDHRRAEVQALEHTPVARQTSLTKYKFKDKMIDNLKTATREHRMPSTGSFPGAPLYLPWSRSLKPALIVGLWM